MNKKLMHRAAALVLSLILAFAALLPCSAVSLSQGDDALKSQFVRGVGPKAGLYAVDYSYYSPVKQGDKTRYPLVVLLGGTKSGEYPGDEVNVPFVSWSSSEYQARFKNAGGAFIIFPRAPQEKGLYWTSTSLYPGLMAALKDFIAKNAANIDTSRIYIGGWCFGCQAVWQVAAQNTNFFAGVFPMASFYSPTVSEIKALKNTPIWIVHNDNDKTASYLLNAKGPWDNVKRYSEVKDKCRFTTLGGSYDSASDNHNAWSYVAREFSAGDYLSTAKTVNGNGDAVKEGSFIAWLSSQKTHNLQADCSCACHSSNPLTRLFFKIRILFCRIFGMNEEKVCKCGVNHW